MSKPKAQKELSDQETDRIDHVHSSIYELVMHLIPDGSIESMRKVDWDLEWIGNIADKIEEVLVKRYKVCTAQEFAPYLDEEETPK